MSLWVKIPDYTQTGRDVVPMCCVIRYVGHTEQRSKMPMVLMCTRAKNHSRRHAAGSGEHIIAVWEDQE